MTSTFRIILALFGFMLAQLDVSVHASSKFATQSNRSPSVSKPSSYPSINLKWSKKDIDLKISPESKGFLHAWHYSNIAAQDDLLSFSYCNSYYRSPKSDDFHVCGVIALELSSGKVRWNSKEKFEDNKDHGSTALLYSSPSISKNTVYVLSDDTYSVSLHRYALSNGRKLPALALERHHNKWFLLDSPIKISQNDLYLQYRQYGDEIQSSLYKFDEKDSHIAWNIRFGGGLFSLPQFNFSEKYLIYRDNSITSPGIIMHNPHDGHRIEKISPYDASCYSKKNPLDISPVVIDEAHDQAYTSLIDCKDFDRKNAIYAFDLKSKALKWKFPRASKPILVTGNELYVLKGNSLLSLDTISGAMNWQWTPKEDDMLIYHVLNTKDLLFIGMRERIIALSKKTHEVIWSIPHSGDDIAIHGNYLVVSHYVQRTAPDDGARDYQIDVYHIKR